MTHKQQATTPQAASRDKRPNLLVICTDQQHWQMMSCAGNSHLKTPAIDSIAATGVRFSAAYCTNPVCVPSRASMFTGVMPSQMSIYNNSGQNSTASAEIIAGGAGNLLTIAGYEVAYSGKQHLPRCLPMASVGFTDILTKDERDECARRSAEFIRQPHDRPWFLVTSLINPHDICYAGITAHAVTEQDRWLIEADPDAVTTLHKAVQRPAGVDDETFWRELCPPLPPNHEPLADEPEAILQHLSERPFKRWIRENWTERDWRIYRWAYHRLTEIVDSQIGTVLNALRQSGQEENTVVIFTSDHGDNDAARRCDHKTLPYDQATRIPMIISQPGHTRAGVVDEHLVCNGLDLIPTLCDYAEVAAPRHLRGRSLRGLAEGRAPRDWRSAVVVESTIARAIRDEQYKYILFNTGGNRMQLFDMRADPLERVNLANDPAMADVRCRLHAELARQVLDVGDTVGQCVVEGRDHPLFHATSGLS